MLQHGKRQNFGTQILRKYIMETSREGKVEHHNLPMTELCRSTSFQLFKTDLKLAGV